MQRTGVANVFAYHDERPEVLEALERAIASSGWSTHIVRPAQDWLLAESVLPGSPSPTQLREAGLGVAEGAHELCRSTKSPPEVRELALDQPGRLATLPGDFGFVAIGDGRAAAVRSCGGRVPFYVWHGGRAGRAGRAGPPRRLAIATRLTDLVRFLPAGPAVGPELELDPLVWGIWSAGLGLAPEHRSLYRDVVAVPRGHAAVWQDGALEVHRYFDPSPTRWPEPTAASAREHAVELRDLLLGSLEDDLDPSGGNLLTLSGGVDSSSLGALAAGRLGLPVTSLSFVPEQPEARLRETRYIDHLTAAVNIERRFVEPLSRRRMCELAAKAPPVCVPVLHPALCALPAVTDECEVSVLFGGEYADEVCGSYVTLPDWALAMGPAGLPRILGKLPTGRKDVLRWAAWQLLWPLGKPRIAWPRDLPEFVRPDVRAEYREWRRDHLRAAAGAPRPWRFLDLWSEQDGYVAMNWEAASELGVRRSMPFLTRGTLELVHRCHPSELVGPGTKRILRAALADDVPPVNLLRRDKGRGPRSRADEDVPFGPAVPRVLADCLLSPSWAQPPPRMPVGLAAALGPVAVAASRLEEARRARVLG